MVNPTQAPKEQRINEWIEYLNTTDPSKLEEPAQKTTEVIVQKKATDSYGTT